MYVDTDNPQGPYLHIVQYKVVPEFFFHILNKRKYFMSVVLIICRGRGSIKLWRSTGIFTMDPNLPGIFITDPNIPAQEADHGETGSAPGSSLSGTAEASRYVIQI
jgi:hypothetical protein